MAWRDDQIRDLVIRTIIGEAGNEGPDGMAAVAHVMKNRADSGAWGDRTNGGLTRVITAPKQFSIWNPGYKWAPSLRAIPTTDPRYQRAGAIADAVFSEQHADNTGGANHYYAPAGMPGGAPPDWAVGKNGQRIGTQYFYKLPLTASNTAGTGVMSPSSVGTSTAAPVSTSASAPADASITPIQSFTGGDYGRQATSAAQPFKGIVIHVTGKPDLQSELAYNSTPDAARGNAYYGYHYLVDRDGKVYQTAPDNVRTNHIMGNSATGLNNENAIGVALIGADKGMTPEQQAAGVALVNQLKAQYNIDPSKIVSHGELDISRIKGLNPDGGAEGKDFITAYRANATGAPATASATPATASATPAAASAASPYFIGDSIAQGLRGKDGQGDTVIGRKPAAVLTAINAAPPEQLRGRPIVLSTGLSNNPSDLASVQAQFDALKAKGVNPADIHVAGLGSRSDIAAASPALQKLVAQNGATYGGDFRAGADGVHPQDYGGVLASLNLGSRPADVAAPQAQPVAAVAPPGSPPIPGKPQNPSAGFVGPGSDKYSIIQGMTAGTSHNPQLTTAANWGNLFGGGTPTPPASAPAAAAPPSQPAPDQTSPQPDNSLAGPGGWANANPLAGPGGWGGMRPPADLAPPKPPATAQAGAPVTLPGATAPEPAGTTEKPPADPAWPLGRPLDQVSMLPGSMLSSAQNLIKLLFPGVG